MDTNASTNTVAHMQFNEYFLKTEGGFAYCYSNGTPQRHSHDDFYEFVVAAEGTFVSEYNGRKRRFGPGSVFFFRIGETHHIAGDQQATGSLISFIIQKDHFENFCNRHFPQTPKILNTPYQEKHLTHEQFEYITSAFNTIDLTPGQNHTLLFELMLFTLVHYTFLQTPSADNPSQKHDIHWYIKEILYHFDRFEYLQTSVEDIYKDYPLSPSALAHQFHKQTGMTLVQYRHVKRMEYAALMLTKYPKSVTEVATSIGYNSLSYFSKKFKEHFGRLPSEFHPRTLNHPTSFRGRGLTKARSFADDRSEN